jgi:hypothetical protein
MIFSSKPKSSTVFHSTLFKDGAYDIRMAWIFAYSLGLSYALPETATEIRICIKNVKYDKMHPNKRDFRNVHFWFPIYMNENLVVRKLKKRINFDLFAYAKCYDQFSLDDEGDTTASLERKYQVEFRNFYPIVFSSMLKMIGKAPKELEKCSNQVKIEFGKRWKNIKKKFADFIGLL